MQTDTILTMKGIEKEYLVGGEVSRVLKGIDLTVDRGEFLAILGPSGSGKSTLMNIIGCMDVADEGEYYLDNIAIHNTKDKHLGHIRNEKIGFVFQKYHLIPTYTVVQNIVMRLLLQKITLKEAEESCMDTIKLLGLGDRLGHKPSELSGGQQQRVAIARALVSKPDILLADEPTGALDTVTSIQIMELIKEISKDRLVIMVTHNPEIAVQYSTRIINLLDGQITSDKTAAGDTVADLAFGVRLPPS